MKKIMSILVLIFFQLLPVIANGQKEIKIEYKHSLKIENNSICITLDNQDNSDAGTLSVNIFTSQNNKPIVQKEITKNISINVFNSLYLEFLSLDFGKIILENESRIGTDGYTISIFVGNFQTSICLNIWNPEENMNYPETTKLYFLLKEIFKIAELIDYL